MRFSRTLLVTAFVAAISASSVRSEDDFEDVEFPPGLLPFDLNGPNVKRSQSVPLGNTKFSASIGYWGRRKDAVDYSISVEKAVEVDEVVGRSVCFEAKFKIADLPKDFSKKRIADVVNFDGATVVFDLGIEKRQFKLPSEPIRRPVRNVRAAGVFGGFEFWLVTACVAAMVAISVAVAFAAVSTMRLHRRRTLSEEWDLD